MNTYLQFNPRNFTNLKKTLSLILGKQMVNISPLMYIYRYVLLSLRSSWSNISCLWIIVGSEQQPKYQALLYAILDVHYTLFAKLLWTYLSGSRSNAVLLILLTSELRTSKMPTAPHNGSKTFTDVIFHALGILLYLSKTQCFCNSINQFILKRYSRIPNRQRVRIKV